MTMIRIGTRNDFKSVLELFKSLDEQHIVKRSDFKKSISSKRYADILDKCYEDNNYILNVAVESNDIIGFGIGRLNLIKNHPFLKDQKIGEILYMLVSDKQKKKGIGKKLLAFLESELTDKGVGLLEMRVYNFNEDAIPEKAGYLPKFTIYEKTAKQK